MAPLNPNNTDRIWVDYTTCGEQHTLEVRVESTVTDADAGASIGAFLAALDSQLRLITIDGARRAVAGSNLSFPIVWAGDPTYGSGAGSHFETAQYISFVGRSSGGRRVRATVFGAVNVQVGGDYRVSPGESAFVADALAALNADAFIFQAIDGFTAVWNNYANCGGNAYWRNKVR